MDWIDKAIRDLCELPDRSSPEDDPEAIVATPSEIRAAIEANIPRGINALQRAAIGGLLAVASAAYSALEDSESFDDGKVLVESERVTEMSNALDMLQDLPDDKPGYTLGEPALAEWALRDLLTPNASFSRGPSGPSAGSDSCTSVAGTEEKYEKPMQD